MALSWQDIQAEALRRIQSREWEPGALIPNEAELAKDLGCARATVNRALQSLADDGWLERRRKAGTRVALSPKRRAQLAIPMIRHEIESRGEVFSYTLISRTTSPMPIAHSATLGLPPDQPAHNVRTLYQANGRPFAYENRWVNLAAAPGFDTAPLDQTNPNEWLVQNTPFSHGTLDYSAAPATDDEARHLNCDSGMALMILERRTFTPDTPVTSMRLSYAPGHRLHLSI